MDPALDMLEIGGLLRKAMCLLKGCEISFDNGEIRFAATSIVPGFKVRNCRIMIDCALAM